MSNPYYTPSYNPYPQSVLVGTGVLFIIVPIVAVSLRFYARLTTAARLGPDDWITLPAATLIVALAIVQIIAATAGGLGGHQIRGPDGEQIHTTQLTVYEKTRYAYEVIGAIGLTLIKLSVLLFFRRIFRVRAFILVNNIVIGLTVAWGISYTFALAFQCVPVSTLWDHFESDYINYQCVEVLPFYLSFAYSDLILDVIIFVLPIPHLWNLKMPLRQKLGVAFIFFLGSLVVSIGIVRTIIYAWVVDFASRRPELWFGDLTWYSSGVLFWHLAENVVGVLCASTPAFAPLFKRRFARGTRSRSTPRPIDTSGSTNATKPSTIGPFYERLDDQQLLRPLEEGVYDGHQLSTIPRDKSRPSN
ncbi:hypothetical protein F5Y17DRAFT_59876 [Xylariaceae sp. FL0594]|nr:hypothetical protein F5Y17DRAFT_59876 [Xylariaceae sp. FL0594]